MKKTLVILLALILTVMSLPSVTFAATIGGVTVPDSVSADLLADVSARNANFNILYSNSPDPYPDHNFPFYAGYGLSTRSDRTLETKEAYKDFALSFTMLRTSVDTSTAISYYLRYVDSNNYVQVRIARHQAQIATKVNGVVSATGWFQIDPALPVEPQAANRAMQVDGQTVELDMGYAVDYLLVAEGASIAAYAKHSGATDYTLLAQLNNAEHLSSGVVRIEGENATVATFYSNFRFYTDAPLTLTQEGDSLLLGKKMTFIGNQGIDVDELAAAITVYENDVALSSENYSVSYVEGTEYQYEITLDTLNYSSVYEVVVDDSVLAETTSFVYTTLPTPSEDLLASSAARDANFDMMAGTTPDPYVNNNYPFYEGYGVSVRGDRTLQTKEKYGDFAVSFTMLRTALETSKEISYYLRYVDANNFVQVKIACHQAQIATKVNGVVTASSWFPISPNLPVEPQAADRAMQVDGQTVELDMNYAVDYLLIAQGATVSAYAKHSGAADYSLLAKVDTVAHLDEGIVKIEGGNINLAIFYSDFRIYSERDLEIVALGEDMLLSNEILLSSTKKLDNDELAAALTVKKSGGALAADAYTLSYVEDSTYNYKITLNELEYGCGYEVIVDDTLLAETYSRTFFSLPVPTEGDMLGSAAARDANFLTLRETEEADPFGAVNFEFIADYGVYARGNFHLRTRETYDNVAVSFTGLRTAKDTTAERYFYLRYQDSNNYLRFRVTPTQTMIESKVGGQVTTTSWVPYALPYDPQAVDKTLTLDGVPVTLDTTKSVDYLLVLFGDTAAMYVKHSGAEEYTYVTGMTGVTQMNAGHVDFSGTSASLIEFYKNFKVYSAAFTAPVVTGAQAKSGETVVLNMTSDIASVPASVTLTDTVNGTTYTAASGIAGGDAKKLVLTLSEDIPYSRTFTVAGDVKSIYGAAASGLSFITKDEPQGYDFGVFTWMKGTKEIAQIESGEITSSITVTKIDADAENTVIFVTAVYEEVDGKIYMDSVSVDTSIELTSVGSSDTLSNTVTVPSTGSYFIRSFVWQDETTINPLNIAAEL